MRDYTELQLKNRLLKHFPEQVAITVVRDLVSRNYVDDQKVAERVAQVRAKNGYGPLKIRAELESLGIQALMIAQLMAELEEGWMAAITHLLNKRTTLDEVRQSRREKGKQIRYLAHRGFSIDQILRAIDEWAGGASE